MAYPGIQEGKLIPIRNNSEITPASLRWPIISLDFEASGLGPHTYPIEAGVALWDGPGQPIRTWSALIEPTRDWLENGDWQPESESIHNIDREELADGLSPAEALSTLHRIIGVGGLAFCDGGAHDHHWLRRLSAAAGAHVAFGLGSWQLVTNSLSINQYMRMEEFKFDHGVPHRAGPDAVLHIQAFAAGLGVEASNIEQIEE